MTLSLFIAVCFSSFFSRKKNDLSDDRPDFFTFATNPKKQYTLYPPDLYSSKRLWRSKQLAEQKQWYYVHIFGDISKVQEHVSLRLDDQIVKNTFILYLSQNQLEKISEHSLVKLIEPSDKIELISPYKETNYFLVQTAPNSEIPRSSNLYTIERVNGEDSYIIRVDKSQNENDKQFIQKKQRVARILAENPAVKVVSTYKKPVLQNDINIGYVQKNNQQFHRDDFSKLNIFDRYVHNHGLTGEGQIITIEDSPIDFRHPMFHDENVPIKFNEDMPNHRKFLFYQSYTDLKGWEENLKNEEHGTHTAGTLAGKSLVSDKSKTISHLFDGAAPDAKLVYAGLYGNISGADLERAMNTHNSRISSNSWGDNDKYVDPLNHEYGLLAYNNPQSIFIFAAGNYAISGNFSVIDPSGSKNVLSVSATSNPILRNAQDYTLQSLSGPSVLIKCNGVFPGKDFQYYSEFLGTKAGEAEIIAVHFDPSDTDAVCKKLNGTYISLLYGDDEMEMRDFIEFCFTEVTNGRLMTTDITGVNKLLENKVKIVARLNSYEEKVLPILKGSYASIGPGNKGMVKPDVTAPGTSIVSSKSYVVGPEPYSCKDINDGCGLAIKEGTSMSTPNVAGNAALVAQYFKSGRWVDSTELDGATMRALLINSCNHPNKLKYPEPFFGHGVVDLSNILPLDGGFGVQIPRQDKATTVTEMGHVVAKIDVKSNKVPLQITLSYLDIVLEQSSPIPLTRDLDLVVVSPDGVIYRGDHLPNGDTQHLSTNEKVIVNKEEIKTGTYTVHVYGNNFFDSRMNKETKKQNFSVVATGDIDNKYIEFKESKEAPCSDADKNHPGYCKCKDGLIGPTCETKILHITEDEANLTLDPYMIHRIKFTSDLYITSFTWHYDYYVKYPAAWISPTCHMSLHEYELNGYVGIYLDKTINISFGTKEICVALFANTDAKTTYYIELDGVESLPDKDNNKNNKDAKLEKILLGIIIGAGVIFVILVGLIIFLIIQIKKDRGMGSPYTNSKNLVADI